MPARYRLMVNHSHSWGPARWLPGPAMGRCIEPKPLVRLMLLVLACMAESPVLEPSGREVTEAAATAAAASLEPVELSGLSTSMAVASDSTTVLLLWRR